MKTRDQLTLKQKLDKIDNFVFFNDPEEETFIGSLNYEICAADDVRVVDGKNVFNQESKHVFKANKRLPKWLQLNDEDIVPTSYSVFQKHAWLGNFCYSANRDSETMRVISRTMIIPAFDKMNPYIMLQILTFLKYLNMYEFHIDELMIVDSDDYSVDEIKEKTIYLKDYSKEIFLACEGVDIIKFLEESIIQELNTRKFKPMKMSLNRLISFDVVKNNA